MNFLFRRPAASDVDAFKSDSVEFPPVGPENFVRVTADFARAYSTLSQLHQRRSVVATDRRRALTVGVMKAPFPAPSLASTEAVALTEAFRKAVLLLHFHSPFCSLWRLWFRLYTHALHCGSRIFPDVELSDESPSYALYALVDVWKGNRHGEPVCIKAIRIQDTIRLKELKRTFRRRSVLHPNVLPILEVSEALFPFCIMNPWMPDGNITQYTQANPDTDRLMLLAQACNGLIYLHGLDILHGGIAPNNILITRDGEACIGDFGIAGAFSDLVYRDHKVETLRYMAPERLPEDTPFPSIISGPSKAGDVYSLGMTSFDVLTGLLSNDDSYTVDWDARRGERPPRPTDPSRNQWLQDPIWDAITTCWSNEPEQRSELAVVYDVFLTLSPQNAQNTKSDKPGVQQRGKLLPRIASFFQALVASEPEIERLVNEMDKRLEDDTVSDRERIKLLNKLCKTCSRHRVIPKSMLIPDCSNGSVEAERGGFADVSQGIHQERLVAIKVVRVYITSDLDVIRSSFCREGVTWKHLRHPNILPLLGVTVSELRFAMVSEWMEHGNINEFVGKHKHVNRTELLVDVANGLAYMHGLRMAHGDLKGANILINKDRRACLADFGLSTITGVATHATAGASRTSLISDETLMSFTAGGTRRWMSPELLNPEMFGISQSEGDRPTRQSDCYALGMVIYEVLCGHHPYVEIESDIMVVNEIMDGVRPVKPEGAKHLGFSDELWRTVELCWQEDRNARPRVEDILSSLNEAAAFWYMRDS